MNAVVQAHVKPYGPTGAISYLLTGNAVCGNCGGEMKGNKHRGQRRYRCFSIDQRGIKVGCGNVCRIAEPVEMMVKEAVNVR
jgi:hypothetical protein